MDKAEAGLLPEVGLLELGVGRVLGGQFVDQGLVGGLGEPALLVHQGEDAQRLYTVINPTFYNGTNVLIFVSGNG